MIGITNFPGLWPDYLCLSTRIVETIDRMLRDNAKDFPNTACGGFDIHYENGLVRIIPIVLRSKISAKESNASASL